jgi:cyanophycinase-like exopeptidase
VTARVLTIMGSGETSPTMIKPHRAILERVGAGGSGDPRDHRTAVFLDTPVGFQENAGEIAERVVDYFAQSVGTPIEVARMRTSFEATSAMDAVRRASYVFSGPGSPTYALAQWATTSIPDLLREKLRTGGAVTFASAAALTLGRVTVPVYEIYKVGQEPHWLDGLDLLAEAGLSAAVIPHFNNAEGGTHDTRFCYLGERRLSLMEEMLPDGAFVLGVDEHTGAVLDLDARTMEVVGVGVVTVRDAGRVSTFPPGTVVSFDDLRSGDASAPEVVSSRHQNEARVEPAAAASPSPLLGRIGELEVAFDDALAAGDGAGAAGAVLDAEEELHAWSQYTSDEVGKARLRVRAMIVRLAEAVVDPTAAVTPFVETLLSIRDSARAAKDFATADLVRDRLVAARVEVGDGKEGTTWRLLS